MIRLKEKDIKSCNVKNRYCKIYKCYDNLQPVYPLQIEYIEKEFLYYEFILKNKKSIKTKKFITCISNKYNKKVIFIDRADIQYIKEVSNEKASK